MSERVCRKCAVSKPLKSFPKAAQCKDGRRSTCHSCHDGVPPPPPLFEKTVVKERPTIVTAAQNNTPVMPGFLEALFRKQEEHDAQILVVPFRYKNPTGMAPGTDLRGRCQDLAAKGQQCVLLPDHEGKCTPNELWWDPQLTSFLVSERTRLHPHLQLAADVKIQPTASRALAGFEALTGPDSCIIGHPKLEFRAVAVGLNGFPKVLTTTGVVTEKNYSNTKAGALGEFHYCLGAVLVEPNGKKFHLRHLLGNKEDGSFTDLNKHYTSTGVVPAARAKALICGDLHNDIMAPEVRAATFGDGGIVETLDPEEVIAHDLNDNGAANHHEAHDPFLKLGRHRAGRTDILAEGKRAVAFANSVASDRRKVYVVKSNHDDFLRRWVVDKMQHGCRDPENMGVFLDSAKYMHDTAKMTPGGPSYGDPWCYWVEKLGNGHVYYLGGSDSHEVMGVECGMHGDAGPGGAKGTMTNLARIGVRVVDGHSHTPEIFEGHWRGGTSTPRHQAYHRGPNSNLNAHVVIYATGKRALLLIIDGEWKS